MSHIIYIYDLYDQDELYVYVSSDLVIEQMLFHKSHICNLCGLHEQFGCVSSIFRAGSGHFFSGSGRVRAAHIEPGSGSGH